MAVHNTATYELSAKIEQEFDDANTVVLRTRIHAGKMLKHLAPAGMLKRWAHNDPDVLVSIKKQLEDFDSRKRKWKPTT